MNLPNTIALWIAGIFLAAVIGYVVYSGWRKIRAVGTFFLLFAIMMAMYGGSKGFYRAVEFPRTDMSAAYLMDNGSYVSSNDVHLAFSASTFMPPDAEIYLDYIPAGSTNDADWTTYTNATLAAFPNPLDFNFENATSNRWACYTTWTPGTPEVTNGIVRIGWMLAEKTPPNATSPPDPNSQMFLMIRTGVDYKDSVPTARDYVQDGLVAMWDGIENAGWGVHDPTATVWKDLVTGTNNWSLTEYGEFIADGLYGDGQGAAADGASSSSFITAECCFNMRSFPSNNKKSIATIFNTGKASYNGRLYFVALPSASKYSVGRTSCFLWGATPPIVTIAFQNTYMSTSNSGPVFLDGIEITSFSNGGYNSAGIETPTLLGRRLSIQNPDSRSCEGVIHSIRLYSRALTADEIAHNHAVDNARFNLPNNQPLNH